MKDMLQYFKQLAIDHQLNFTGQEILERCIMGLDGLQRRVAVLTNHGNGNYNWQVIELTHVHHCSVKKRYGTILPGDLKALQPEDFLEEISLHFEMQSAQPPVDVVFYNSRYNSPEQQPALEKKAKQWQALLSKLTRLPLKKTA